jgi:signal transduction histidine kinase
MTTMKLFERGQPFSLKIAVALLVLLAVLATLQYQWLGQVSDAEGQRMRANLRMAVARFVDDFDAEVTRAFFYFFPDPRARMSGGGGSYFERLEQWKREAPRPDLLENVYIVEMGESELEIHLMDQSNGQLVPIDLPDEFRPLAQIRERFPHEPFRRPRPPGELPSLLLGQVPAILVPDGLVWQRRPPQLSMPIAKLIVLELDRQYLAEIFLPDLASRYFGHRDGDFDYDISVTDAREPEEAIYTTQPEESLANLRGDASAHFFSIRPRLVRRQPWPREDRPPERNESKGSQPPSRMFGRMFSDREGGPWLLTVRHRAGSLEAALTRARTRNLFIGFAVLFMLAASVVMMVISTERAKELARQKIEFVAGVSHELKTPLSVIRSAGENLADGKIVAPEQVKRYGSLVESEGRRLTDLVDQVLHFAGTQSLANKAKMSVVSLAGILDGALADAQPAIRERAIEVDVELPGDLPNIKVDASAVRRAIQNLIDNAVKYAGDEKWIGLRAGVEGKEVFVRVEDKGPGIDKTDLPHVFEPFYRGQSVGRIHGSGLGLSLVKQIVEAHGGRVSVETASGQGSTFTIYLPTAVD